MDTAIQARCRLCCEAEETGAGTSVLSGTSTICGRPPSGLGFHSTRTTSKPCTCRPGRLRIITQRKDRTVLRQIEGPNQTLMMQMHGKPEMGWPNMSVHTLTVTRPSPPLMKRLDRTQYRRGSAPYACFASA